MEKEFDFKNIGKRMPYRTPDGFFGKMQKQVLERTQAERFNRQNSLSSTYKCNFLGADNKQ